jgi:LEA14-like dessication related protein
MKWLKSSWLLVCVTVIAVVFLTSLTITIPKFSGIGEFEILDFSDGKLKANAVLKIQNDNWFSYAGKGLQFKIYFKDHLVAKGQSDESFRFEKKSENLLPIHADFFADSLYQDLKEILFRDSIQFKVEISGNFTFLKINSSTELQTWIKTKDLLDALITNSMGDEGMKLEKIKLKNISVQQTCFDASFRFKNKLPFDILLKEIRCGVYADKALKTKVADWAFPVQKLIKINENELIEGAANVNNVNSALSGITKVLKGFLDYYINGHVLVSVDGREIKIPLKQHFKLNLLTQDIEILTDLK